MFFHLLFSIVQQDFLLKCVSREWVNPILYDNDDEEEKKSYDEASHYFSHMSQTKNLGHDLWKLIQQQNNKDGDAKWTIKKISNVYTINNDCFPLI